MKLNIIFSLCLLLIIVSSYELFPIEFEELDKPPEGAHEGQMLLGTFIYFGLPYGNAIDAEDDFLEGSTYTFENEVTKAIEVSHLSFGVGISYEYMPLDHIGINTRIRRSWIVQRSNFGSSYENWTGYLYRDTAFYIGPAIHATTRKRWDFSFIPLIGYAFSKYYATPVGGKIISDYWGKKSKSFHTFSFGSELNCIIYFSGGLYIGLGIQWIRNRLKFGSAFNLTNPQTNTSYFDGKTSSSIDTYTLLVSAGYAFSY